MARRTVEVCRVHVQRFVGTSSQSPATELDALLPSSLDKAFKGEL